MNEPLSLLKLLHTLKSSLFRKVHLLFEVISNGIMDYLVAGSESVNFFFGTHKSRQMASFTSIERAEEKPSEEVEKAASLDWEKIKPADRVTFLLNYLFLVINNNEILAAGAAADDISILCELFLACLKPYVEILSNWVTKG